MCVSAGEPNRSLGGVDLPLSMGHLRRSRIVVKDKVLAGSQICGVCEHVTEKSWN